MHRGIQKRSYVLHRYYSYDTVNHECTLRYTITFLVVECFSIALYLAEALALIKADGSQMSVWKTHFGPKYHRPPTLSQNHFLPTHKLIGHICPKLVTIQFFLFFLIDWFEILVKIQLCAVIWTDLWSFCPHSSSFSAKVCILSP